MWNIYTEYLDKANKIDKKYNEIHIGAIKLKQELHIINEKRELQVVSFFQ